VIVDDLDVERIAITEFKADTPTVVDRHGPLPFPRALQFVQSDAPQWTEILKTLGHVECRQQIDCSIDVKAAAEARFAFISDKAEFASEDLLDV
jgi:hypothetical protein